MLDTNSTDQSRHFEYVVRPYVGFEKEVLELRNKSRSDLQNRQYMNWRYDGQSEAKPALIFYVALKNGEPIGMAGSVFRTFWVDGVPCNVPVLGDISLNAEYRGKGIALRLLKMMNAYMKEQESPFSLVLPNEAAYRTLSAAEWQVQDKMKPLVFWLDPSSKISEMTGCSALSRLVGFLVSRLAFLFLSLINDSSWEVKESSKFDDSFDELWKTFPKRNLILSDRSSSYLKWRYTKHPQTNYSVLKFFFHKRFVGYVICSDISGSGTCTIYDLLALKTSMVRPICHHFLLNLYKKNSIRSVRVSLNSQHPYWKIIRNAGFISRKDTGVVQIYKMYEVEKVSPLTWHICQGDKDV